MKKLIQLSVVMASAIYLTACGGGGSSNNSQPSSDAKTVMKIGNDSPFDYASLVVQSANGTVFYDGQFKCVKTDTHCYLNLTQDINESVTLLFKDPAGKLVSAVVLADVPGTYISLYPSAASTGFYLMSRLARDLKASNNLSWENVNDRVQNFFTNYDSPDGTLDPYEEVGEYYASQLIKGVGSEAAFLSAFEQRLLKWDVALNEELPTNGAQYTNLYQRILAYFKPRQLDLISSAYAQESSCSSMLSTFLTFSENLAGAVPIVGDVVAGAAAIGNSYCDNTDAKLDKIMSQLNDLQNSVDAVDRNVSAIGRFLYDQAANDKTMQFQKHAKAVMDRKSQYDRFLINNNVSSLQDYFAKKGGWDAAIAAGSSALDDLLGTAYKNSSTSNLFEKTLDATRYADFQSYLSALVARCAKQPTSTDENFVMTRQQCNNIIQANSGRLIAAQGMLLPIVKDVYAVLNAYKEKAQNTYQLPTELKSYASAYADIKDAFSRQQTVMVNDYKNKIGEPGYFNAFEGLNAELINSLVSRQCNQSGSGRSNGPAIIGWYQPDTNPKNNYIVTDCKMGSSPDRIVARYYYNDQGSVNANDVANVLGVPVAYHYVSSDLDLYDSEESVTRESYDQSSYYDIEAPSLIAAGEGNGPVIKPVGAASLYSKNGVWIGVPLATYRPVWIVFKSKDASYHLVAKFALWVGYQRINWSKLSCVAAPCLADRDTKEWLIFHDATPELRETLDLRDTGKRDSLGAPILRLAPVNQ